MATTSGLLTPMEASVPADPRTPKFNMPSVYRPKTESCFRCKVGYYASPAGTRQRREFRLGDDPVIAHMKAIQLAQAWVKEEERHWKRSAQNSAYFPADPATLPVWTGLPPIEAQGGLDWLAVPPETLPGDEAEEASAPSVSLQRASEEFLERVRKKADRDARSYATHRWYEREFHLGLVAGGIDATMPVSGITLATVEAYCEFWTDLKARAAENPRKRFGWRSAWNRVDAFGRLLRDLKGRGNGFVYPERATMAFEEAKATVAGPMTAIQTYDAARLKKIFDNGDDRLRLYVYCALNFGMYQSDIGQQVRRRHTEEHGGLIEIGGETYLQWHRHKLRRRQRAQMRHDDHEKPVLLTHYVWPETRKLLDLHAAPLDNRPNLWLLNGSQQPLWRQEAHHKRPVDNVSTAYYRAARTAEVRLPFDQIRKFGATACESIGSIEVQEMYRGERREGSSRVYVLQDFAGKLTPFLKAWADRLRADDVLY